MVGFDLARPPHPYAVSILIPFLSGGVFLIGFAYSHPGLTERFFTEGHMDSVLRAAVLLILTYATGLILEGVVLALFFFLTYGFGVLATRILVKALSRSKTLIRASAWPSFRRAATVVLGEAMVPQSPNMSGESLVEKVPEYRGMARAVAAAGVEMDPLSELVQVPVPSGAKLKSEAPKTSLSDFDRQWRDIHLTLRRLRIEKKPSHPELLSTSLILSVAAPIVIERWLSFGVPSVLYWAAILACVIVGLVFLVTAMMDFTDPYPVQSFLFDHFLARSAGTKE